MKKMILALVAALVMSIGVTAAPSVAAYPDTVKTKTTISFSKNPIKPGSNFKVYVKVRAGSAKPTGTVKLRIFGNGYRKTLKSGKATFSFHKSKKSKVRVHHVKANYEPRKGSIYKKSSDTATLYVKKKK